MNIRKKDLSCDHQSSMGLKSGEYGDKQITLAPQASIIGTIDANLWAGKLSITTTAPFHNSGHKNFSINTANARPSIESFIVSKNRETAIAIAFFNPMKYSRETTPRPY